MVLVASGALGFSAATTQLVLLRELLGYLSGNELTFGICLGCWLALTAIGSWIGTVVRQVARRMRVLAGGIALVALIAIAQVVALRAWPDAIFTRGTAADPLTSLVGCVLVLGPFCLGSGALVILACRSLALENEPLAIGRIYAADAAGSIGGALFFTFVLSRLVDHVAALCWTGALVCLVSAWIAWRRKRRVFAVLGAAATTGLVGLAGFGNVDGISTQWQYRTPVVHRATSPYGRLVVTENAGQLTFFENGVPVIFTANAATVEEIVHYAMVQRADIQSVLVIGGGPSGAAREILRYPKIRQVTCLELDPVIVAAGRRLLPDNLSDPRLRLVTGDARRFVQRTNEQFDAILIALPDPTTFQLNRYYTAEFLLEAKRALRPGGVLALAVGSYENYVSPELRSLLASMRRTLETVFFHVTAIPGGRVYFLASEGAVDRTGIAAALERRTITPKLVNRHYLDAMLAPDRLADIDRATAEEAPVNHDLRPVLCYFRMRHWLSQFTFSTQAFSTVLAVLLIASLIFFRGSSRLIFGAGFAASTLEVVLLVVFQAYYGSVYQQVGLIVASFMAGLTAGAVIANRTPATHAPARTRNLSIVIIVLATACAFLLPDLAAMNRSLGVWTGQAIILTVAFLLAGLVGAQFAYASIAPPTACRHTAPRIFSADLIGASVGALATSAILLPLLGVETVCLLTAALNVGCVALGRRRRAGY